MGSTLVTPDGDVVRKGKVVGILTPRELALLRCLAGKRGEFVSGEEIMAEVWDKTSVIRANLPQQVSTLRGKLGPDGVSVVGRRGRGYRLRQVGD